MNENPLPLSIEGSSNSLFRIRSDGYDSSVEISSGLFKLAFFGANGAFKCQITEVFFDGTSLRVSGPLQLGEVVYGLGQRFDVTNQEIPPGVDHEIPPPCTYEIPTSDGANN